MDFFKGGKAPFVTRQPAVPLSIPAYRPAALRTRILRRPCPQNAVRDAMSFADELQMANNTAQDPLTI